LEEEVWTETIPDVKKKKKKSKKETVEEV
jgi:hypothetical protein